MSPDSILDILYVGTLPPHRGGSAIVGRQLVTGLAARGHRVRALAPRTPDRHEDAAHITRDLGDVTLAHYEVAHVETSPDVTPPPGSGRREGEDLHARLAQLIAHGRPDVIIAGRESFADHVLSFACHHELPSMLMIQGTTTFGMLSGTIPPDARDAWFAHARRADRVVVVARHLAGPLRVLGLRNAVAIPNGVDTRRFAPGPRSAAHLARLSIPADAVVVGHLSNLKRLKRTSDLLAAAATALRSEPRLLFLVIGDGPGRADLERDCARAGLAGRFRFTGWVDHDRVPEHLQLCDMVVMPSEAEALALAYLETMACGRLLIASDIAAAREVIDDGRTGLLVRRADTGALADAIVRAARDPGLRLDVGRHARTAALRHGIDRTLDGYVALLRDLVARTCSGDGAPAQVRDTAGEPAATARAG